MKKILLGTSALMAISSIAFAGEAPKMVVSGSAGVFVDVQNYSAKVSLADKKDTTNTFAAQNAVGTKYGDSGNVSGHDIIQPAYQNEIKFSGMGQTDSGLTYGAYVEIRPIGATTSDEAGVSFGGEWGKIEIGQVDSINHNIYLTGSDFNGSSSGGPDNIANIAGGFKAITLDGISADDAKITYTAPIIAGLSGGLSYAPNSTGQNSLTTIGLTYGFKSSDAAINLAAYSQSGTADTKATRNQRAYHLGASVGFGAVTVALGYFNNGRGGLPKAIVADAGKTENGKTIDLGVSVAMGGNSTVGASVTHGKANTNFAKDATETWYSVGATTVIADGATLVASVDYDIGDTGEVNGNGKSHNTQILVGTRISF